MSTVFLSIVLIVLIFFGLAHLTTLYMLFKLNTQIAYLLNRSDTKHIALINKVNELCDLFSIANTYLSALSQNQEKILKPTEKETKTFNKRSH